jgi:hypothetical protein
VRLPKPILNVLGRDLKVIFPPKTNRTTKSDEIRFVFSLCSGQNKNKEIFPKKTTTYTIAGDGEGET